MNSLSPFIGTGIGVMFINFLTGFFVSSQIKEMLKVHYPEIYRNFGGSVILDNSIRKSLSTSKMVMNPPSEITYRPLLRLFRISRMQNYLQAIIMLLIVLCAILGPMLNKTNPDETSVIQEQE